MKDLNKCTPTELLKQLNDTKAEHNKLKEEIIQLTNEFDEIEKKINDKIDILSTVELKYVELIEELNNRENVV